MTRAEASLPEQIREALQRFTVLSECAIRACDARDGDALAAAIDARELVTARLRQLGSLHSAAAPRGESAAAREARAALAECARAAARANQDLVRRVGEARDDVARQLERLTHDETAVAGYARAMPRASALDLRR
jgi:hypothetical protein